jgi:hypothetical protein
MNHDAQSSIPANSDLLGELLHSLSQPLTALRCSLELSLDAGPQQQLDAVTSALEQTENVIGTIQLMREYLDAQTQRTTLPEIAFMPVLQGVVEDLSSLAALRRVQLRLVGTCQGRLRTSRWHLRKALEYLLSAMIEEQQPDSELALQLGVEPAGAVVRIRGRSGLEQAIISSKQGSGSCQQNGDRTLRTTQRARLAIAARVLENAGVGLTIEENECGLMLRMPYSPMQ